MSKLVTWTCIIAKDKSLDFFANVTMLGKPFLHASPVSQHFLFYHDNEKEKLAKTLRM